MSTMDSKKIVDQMIANHGHYEDDPQAIEIASFHNDWGKLSYHVSYSVRELEAFHSSPCVHDIVVLWSLDLFY
jgi:hypothetical protein